MSEMSVEHNPNNPAHPHTFMRRGVAYPGRIVPAQTLEQLEELENFGTQAGLEVTPQGDGGITITMNKQMVKKWGGVAGGCTIYWDSQGRIYQEDYYDNRSDKIHSQAFSEFDEEGRLKHSRTIEMRNGKQVPVFENEYQYQDGQPDERYTSISLQPDGTRKIETYDQRSLRNLKDKLRF